MFRTIWLYIRQRFNLLVFSLLAAFLLLYSNGLRWNLAEFLTSFLYTLVLLFWFRLFDDICSREIDANKSERIYTKQEPLRQLRLLLIVLVPLLVATTFLYNVRAGIMLSSFLILNTLAYRSLFDNGNWRVLLPLLKYPFLALLLFVMFAGERMLSIERLLTFLSLLPVFILFEWLDDPSYHLRRPVAGMLLVTAHLLLLPAMSRSSYPIALAGIVVISLMAYARDRIAIWRPPYLLMIYFLTLRLLLIDHVA